MEKKKLNVIMFKPQARNTHDTKWRAPVLVVSGGPLTCQRHISLPSPSSLTATKSRLPPWCKPSKFPNVNPAKTNVPSASAATACISSIEAVPSCAAKSYNSRTTDHHGPPQHTQEGGVISQYRDHDCAGHSSIGRTRPFRHDDNTRDEGQKEKRGKRQKADGKTLPPPST